MSTIYYVISNRTTESRIWTSPFHQVEFIAAVGIIGSDCASSSSENGESQSEYDDDDIK